MENKKIKLAESKENCCGCNLCKQICPVDAITMELDEYGFLYPSINQKKCIRCNKCVSHCMFSNKEKKDGFEAPDTYAAVNKNKVTLKKSASGGVFSALAENIISCGGVVFGAAMEVFDGHLKAKHIYIEKIAEIGRLQGSKYVQSEIGESFEKAKKFLIEGRMVLFSGTPCQIDSLNTFLEREYENLYTIDIICHGVPSQHMFSDYIGYLEKKKKMKIIQFDFRNKLKGWGCFGKMVFKDARGTEKIQYLLPIESSYYKMFLEGMIYRKSCYNCKYASGSRYSDLTIGDYWGVEKYHADIFSTEKIGRGISCVLINTDKGKNLLNKGDLELYKTVYSQVRDNNMQLYKPVDFPTDWDSIFSSYKKSGYKEIEKYYKKRWRVDRYKLVIKKIVPSQIKKILKGNKK